MKKTLFKISSFSMALLVMFSTMSYTIESCVMGSSQTKYSKDTLEGKNCCNNEQITINGQNELNVSFDNLTNDQQIFVATFTFNYINLFEGLENKTSSFIKYPPPFIVKSIYKLDETYLI